MCIASKASNGVMQLYAAISGGQLVRRSLLVLLWVSGVLSIAEASQKLQIFPTPHSRQDIPVRAYKLSFLDFPLAVEAVVPYALVLVGVDKSSELFIQAATMDYVIGQWSQEPGTSLEMIKANQNLGPLVLDKNLTRSQIRFTNRYLILCKRDLGVRLML